MSDTLWNPQEGRDPELEELESSVQDARWQGWPGAAPQLGPRRVRTAWMQGWARRSAAALLVLGAAWLGWGLWNPALPSARYHLAHTSGAVQVGGVSAVGGVPLVAGEEVRTGSGASARLQVGDIGTVELGSEALLRVGEAPEENGFLLHLEKGSLTASILATPRRFQVGTPAGVAVDLGCVYRMRVEADGRTRLEVISGRVSLETARRRVVVPGDASAWAEVGGGPGTPVWNDASAAFRSRVELLDRGGVGAHPWPADPPSSTRAVRVRALGELLELARARDSLSLWHLIAVLPRELRPQLCTRLSAFYPIPAGVDFDACVAAEANALNRWRSTMSW